MKKLFFLSIIALSVMIVSCCKQTTATEEKPTTEQQLSQEMAAYNTAMGLAAYGYEVESPMALIEAADILVSTHSDALVESEKTSEAGEGETAEKAEKAEITPAKLLATAKEWAGEDANLLALAATVEEKMATSAEEIRGGAVNGPHIHYDRVNAHSTDTYTISFRGNELAEVMVIGDGDTDLDLYIYDENMNFITKDDDYSDNCIVSFNPSWTGKFYVKIKNRGNVYNNYVLMTN